MPEFRQNLATKEWVIIAPERAARPKAIEKGASSSIVLDAPKHDPHCPFCVGNEDKTPNEIDRVEKNGKWVARVIPNKFPILSVDQCDLRPNREKNGMHLYMKGCGSHELVIEHPDHNQSLGTMNDEEVTQVLSLYRKRHQKLTQDPHILMTTIFRNHGAQAGASQRHPHSQIIATRLVPTHIRYLLIEAQRHFDDFGTCVYCEIANHEREVGERMIFENDGAMAFCPYASTVPYEAWIVPKVHRASFGNTTDGEIVSVSKALRLVLGRFAERLGNPAYNLTIKTSPYPMQNVPFFQWHLQILPRITTPGGFEMGSRINVNTVAPEEAAKLFR